MKTNDITRNQVEDFLYDEAALLDAWQLDDWLKLLTEDAIYQVPSTDAPDSNARNALFLIADDVVRIRARVKRLNDTEAHAEFPHSRTRRMISNVRITERNSEALAVRTNFSIYRYRRNSPLRHYVGRYEYLLRVLDERLMIAERRAILDTTELGTLGAVSFIL